MYRPTVIASIALLAFLVSASVADVENARATVHRFNSKLTRLHPNLDAASPSLSTNDQSILLKAASTKPARVTGTESADSEHDRALLDLPGERLLIGKTENRDSSATIANRWSLSQESDSLDHHVAGSSDRSQAQAKREAEMATEASIDVSTTPTNESFAEAVCTQLAGSSDGRLTITGASSCPNLVLPSCTALYALSSVKVTTCIVVESFAVFPPSLINLDLSKAVFSMNESFTLPTTPSAGPSSSAPSAPFNASLNGFDEDGGINWDEFSTLLPNLISLTITETNLRGPLPAVLLVASLEGGITLNKNQLSGTIPSSIFSALPANGSNSFAFYASDNMLTGTIPETLFDPFEDRDFVTFLIDFSDNDLSGNIPPQLLQPLMSGNITSFSLDLSGNNLNGSLPDGLFAPSLMAVNLPTQTTLSFSVSSNQLTGSLPASFFATLPAVTSITLSLDNNKFSGSLPAPLIPNGYYDPGASASLSAYLNLSANSFTGSIPSTLLGVASLSQNVTLNTLTLYLDNNKLDTLPDALFHAYLGPTELRTLSVSTLLTISIISNNLAGPLPGTMLAHVGASGLAVTMYLDNNRISGAFPADAFATFPSDITSFILFASNNSFTTLPPECPPGISYLNFAQNALASTIPSSYGNCKLVALFATDNPGLTGTIPPAYLGSPTLFYLYAGNTSLSGDLSTSFGASATIIDLSGTKIDFCSNASLSAGFSSYAATCNLNDTSACACVDSYTMCSTNVCPPAEPTTPPTAAPPTNPSSSPSTPAPSCPAATRPTSEFVCIDGHWTAPATNAPILTLPSGAGSVIVTGNVSSSAIIIDGLGTTITIEGCASNLTQVVIELDAETIKKLGSKTVQPLITLSASATACTNLSAVGLSTKLKSSTCKSIKSEKVLSTDGGTLSALFTVSSSGCNTWWIILVSVLVAVVIIGAIVAVIVAMLWNRKKAKRNTKTLAKARASVRSATDKN